MGLTPLEGLPGATRSGSIDPSLIFHYTSHASRLSSSSTEKIHITQAEEILNAQSGWKALTGTTDFGVITQRALEGDEQAHLALEIMVDRVVGFVGSYWVKMAGKVDALVFAGGIGERGTEFRRRVCAQTEILGFGLDEEKNVQVCESKQETLEISSGEMKVLVVRTDEQVIGQSLRCADVGGNGERVFAGKWNLGERFHAQLEEHDKFHAVRKVGNCFPKI